jgi:hypothetical protein
MLQLLYKAATTKEDGSCSATEQACLYSQEAPSIEQTRKQNRLARAALRVKSVWTGMVHRQLDFSSQNMDRNAYVQF